MLAKKQRIFILVQDDVLYCFQTFQLCKVVTISGKISRQHFPIMMIKVMNVINVKGQNNITYLCLWNCYPLWIVSTKIDRCIYIAFSTFSQHSNVTSAIHSTPHGLVYIIESFEERHYINIIISNGNLYTVIQIDYGILVFQYGHHKWNTFMSIPKKINDYQLF